MSISAHIYIYIYIYIIKLMACWLFGFYSISTLVGYLKPNPFLYRLSVLFQTIQFNMSIQFNCQKTFLYQANHFSQTVLIQPIQFFISMDFIYTQSNVKTVQFSVSTISIWKTVQFQIIQFSINSQSSCQNSSISSNSV